MELFGRLAPLFTGVNSTEAHSKTMTIRIQLRAATACGFALLLASGVADAADAAQTVQTTQSTGNRAAVLCRADQLALRLDDGGGDFNGMSHSGTYIVLRNRGNVACVLPGRVPVSFLDAHRRVLRASVQPMPGMHPGPVVRPVTVAAKGEVRRSLRWVSGEVFDNTQCIDPAYVRLRVGQGALTARFRGHLCGTADDGPRYQVVPFKSWPE
ncbi:DUF4232 domain-containing protein [Paraburkholderia tropica]|uniref:DUF4232 domain-containing protein n=1 Tax=Paraburkholderia tropica TaxID=92647 RepID=UPI000F551E84|nr:DUF4232 domain-containing protein [Paraburkholderia tropica]RQN35025.1 DUF4232 domain-containing protein [Paraburkholderia tropica]